MSQPFPLVDQLKSLENLQELDLKIDSLKKYENALPAGLKTVDDSLLKLRQSLDAKKQQMEEIEKAHKQARSALDLNQDRLVRSNSKLEQVHNAQEFQAATKEIEQLKKLSSGLEEQDQKFLQELESLKKEVELITQEVEKIQTERESQASVVLGQVHQYKTDIDSLLAERAQFCSQVDQKILVQYDRVRGARGGIGIVPAVAGRCKGCNMMVPAQLYNEVQRALTLHSCPSCHRLLFVPLTVPLVAKD